MELGQMPKLRFARAAEALAGLALSDDAKPLLKGAMTPAAYLAALLAAGLSADAIRLLAIALPRREAVWWACLAAREALTDPVKPPENPVGEVAALTAAENWVYQPSEENRRACYGPAEAQEFSTPSAYAAMAAYWSGGSLAPPDAPVVIPPGDALTGTAAGAAVLLAAARNPSKIKDLYRSTLERAVNIANGGDGRHL